MRRPTWQGTERELARLQRAIERHCDCEPLADYGPPHTCQPHNMLSEQTVLDHLLYVFRVRATFLRNEFTFGPPD